MLEGAVIILLDAQDRVLLLKRHGSSRFAPEKWGFPGGKIEAHESPDAAAIRETKEETDLTVRNLQDLGQFDQVRAYLSRDYEGEVTLDHEHTDWGWVTIRGAHGDHGEAPQMCVDSAVLEELAPNVLEIYERGISYGDE